MAVPQPPVPISALPPGVAELGSLIETAQPVGSVFTSTSVTLEQVATLVLQQMFAPSVTRFQAGYGIQFYENDPAYAAHPWRTMYLNMGTVSFDSGVPTIVPVVPTMISAVNAGPNNTLIFSWLDTMYGGTGHLVIYKNGVLLTTVSSSTTSYVDTGSTGVTYQVLWTNSTFSTPLSNSVTT